MKITPLTDAERLVWSYAYWARLNHEQEKFNPSAAKTCADQVLAHARDVGVVEAMAAELMHGTRWNGQER